MHKKTCGTTKNAHVKKKQLDEESATAMATTQHLQHTREQLQLMHRVKNCYEFHFDEHLSTQEQQTRAHLHNRLSGTPFEERVSECWDESAVWMKHILNPLLGHEASTTFSETIVQRAKEKNVRLDINSLRNIFADMSTDAHFMEQFAQADPTYQLRRIIMVNTSGRSHNTKKYIYQTIQLFIGDYETFKKDYVAFLHSSLSSLS